jgi:glycosyltransferase involved in cell wall biosynthesis
MFFVHSFGKSVGSTGHITFGYNHNATVFRFTESVSDKFVFGGFVRGKQWRDAYHLMDGFVMTSVSEPFGLTALEAAHHDTALLISKQSGVGEIMQNIKRFDYWDVDLLASQIVDIAKSPELQQALKQGSKDEYTNISWGDAANQMIRLYKEASK